MNIIITVNVYITSIGSCKRINPTTCIGLDTRFNKHSTSRILARGPMNKQRMSGVTLMSKQPNKLTRSALYIREHAVIFCCPICSSSMEVRELKSLSCSNQHTFDFSKQGYLNLMTHHTQTNYDKELFDARREVIVDSGFFDLFTREITKQIKERVGSKPELTMVDMGAGEGSHLEMISRSLQENHDQPIRGIGIDISKEGMLAAAKHYENHMWLVADLAHPPLQDGICDVILNILSPSNYEEFNRLLTKDGLIIKVVPRSDYLKELRQYFYQESEKEEYSNIKIVELFKDRFTLVDRSTVSYSKRRGPCGVRSLGKMTPLTWGVDGRMVDDFLRREAPQITIDFDVLMGKKQSR